NIPVPSTPSSSLPNDNAYSLRKAKSAVEMSSAYERKRRTTLPPSKLRESVSANEATPTAPKARHLKIQQVPSAAESLGHQPHVQAPQAPVNEVNRSRLMTKKSLPNFSLKKPTSARSVDINNASASTTDYHAGDVSSSARREFMGQVSTNQAFFSALIPSGEHQEQKIRAASSEQRRRAAEELEIVGTLHFGWAFKLSPTMTEMARRWGNPTQVPLVT
ncbi:hypothetical protein KC352_g40747, partial [Hortaea werneckii]